MPHVQIRVELRYLLRSRVAYRQSSRFESGKKHPGLSVAFESLAPLKNYVSGIGILGDPQSTLVARNTVPAAIRYPRYLAFL
jgi:hypothetical protein